VAPLEPSLRGVHRLIVVSPDLLHGAPVEAMRDSLGRRLADRFTISYAPSALLYARSAATEAQRLPPSRWNALLVGDPPAGNGAQRPGSRPALPAAREEIRRLAALLPSETVLNDADASPAHLGRLARAGTLANYQLVHFATHATGDETWLRESALVFGADANSATRESGDRLATTEIASSWRLDADLVTLAACQSMIGPASKTDGFLGLQQALFAVGARRLLVSAWRVDDQATELLMRRFYQLLLARSDRPGSEALALADARRWVRDWTAPDGSRPYAHPVYWAGFVLIEGGLGGLPHGQITNLR
jgi:CHAT domain-containing protein